MTTEALDLALQLAQRGISIIPVRADGSKAPDAECLPRGEDGRPTWAPYQKKIAPAENIRNWWGNKYERAIAAICGAVSGNLEDLDIDAPELAGPWRELVEQHEGGVDLLKRLVIVRTRSGGWHCIYRCSAPVEGNQRLARKPGEPAKDEPKIVVLFETSGEGGAVRQLRAHLRSGW